MAVTGKNILKENVNKKKQKKKTRKKKSQEQGHIKKKKTHCHF